MRIAPFLSIAAACMVAGCSAGSGQVRAGATTTRLVPDSTRIAQVEQEARNRGVRVLWINSPMMRKH